MILSCVSRVSTEVFLKLWHRPLEVLVQMAFLVTVPNVITFNGFSLFCCHFNTRVDYAALM